MRKTHEVMKMINENISNDELIVDISGTAIFENVPLNATYKGKYAAYRAYLFCLENLSQDGVEIYINNKQASFDEFRKLAELQSERHEVLMVEHKTFQSMIIA
jgi:hypothetical protein